MALFSNLHPLTSTVLMFKNKAARKNLDNLRQQNNFFFLPLEETLRATDISAIPDNFLTYNVTAAVL